MLNFFEFHFKNEAEKFISVIYIFLQRRVLLYYFTLFKQKITFMKNHRIELKRSFYNLSMTNLAESKNAPFKKKHFLSFQIKSSLINNDLYEVNILLTKDAGKQSGPKLYSIFSETNLLEREQRKHRLGHCGVVPKIPTGAPNHSNGNREHRPAGSCGQNSPAGYQHRHHYLEKEEKDFQLFQYEP